MMKKIALYFVICIFFLGFFGCTKETPDFEEAEIVGIEIDQTSLLNEYDIEEFDLREIRIIVKKSDNTNIIIPLDESMLLESDREKLTVLGTHTLNISYSGFQTILTVTLKDKDLKEYTIKFITNTFPEQIFITVISGEYIDALPLISKEGYLLEGWFYEDELVKVPFNYNYDYNIELEARWIIDEYEYEIKNDYLNKEHIIINKYTGSSKDIVLPNTIEGLPVKNLNWESFNENNNYESVTLPKHFPSFNYIDFTGKSINVDSQNPNICSVDGVLYNKDKTNLIKYPRNKDSIAFSIPSTVESISLRAFANTVNLEQIVIPNSVLYIFDQAFMNSSLNNVVFQDISNLIEIGNGAFASSQVKSIVIPNSVEKIGIYAFSSAKNLNQLTFEEDSKVTKIGYGAFSNTAITKVTIPKTVTEISDFAFSQSPIKSLILEDNSSLTSIGESAFFLSEIESINIPKGVTNIGLNAFEGCTKYYVDEENLFFSSVNGVLFNKDKSNLIRYPSSLNDLLYVIPKTVLEIETYAFSVNETLLEIRFEEGSELQIIDDFAFFWATELTQILIPDTVTYIGKHAFNNTSIRIETLPSSVEEIGEFAFCDNVADIVNLPASLRIIGNGAFYNVLSFNIDENNPNFTVVDGVLYNKDITELILYPNKSTVTEYEILDTVEVIRTNAFQWSHYLKTIKIPSSVRKIDNFAFFNMLVLNRIEITANSNFELIQIEGAIFHNVIPNIYVNASLLQTYKNDVNWNRYNEKLFALEE